MFLTFIFAIIWLFILIALIFLATLLVQDTHRAAPPPELTNLRARQ